MKKKNILNIQTSTRQFWARNRKPLQKWFTFLAYSRRRSFRLEKTQRKSKTTFADTYHGKVVTLEAARQLVMVIE